MWIHCPAFKRNLQLLETPSNESMLKPRTIYTHHPLQPDCSCSTSTSLQHVQVSFYLYTSSTVDAVNVQWKFRLWQLLEFPTHLHSIEMRSDCTAENAFTEISALWTFTSIKEAPNCSFLLKQGSAPQNYSFIHHVIKSVSSVNDLALKLFSRKAGLWQLLL